MNLSKATILGAHDSTSYGIKFPLSIFAKCQSITLEKQLELGVRYFDIRLNKDESGMMCYHGIACCHISWKEVLVIFETFLNKYPKEFLLVRVYRADDQTGHRVITNKEWKEAFYKESGDYINVVTHDVDISKLLGKINVINVNWEDMLSIEDAGGFSLDCKNEDITLLLNRCNKLVNNGNTFRTKMISTHADGSIKLFNNIKYLKKIPYPRGFFNMFNKRATELNIKSGIYVFDFVNKIDKNIITKLLSKK